VDDPRSPDDPSLTRRTLLQAGTTALIVGAGAPGPARAQAPEPQHGRAPDAPRRPDEWRNRQEGMAYRRLGRTGMMVSEVVCGGDPITPENFRHLEKAIERGLNYLDMAPAYHDGGTEEAYGKLLFGGQSSRRDKVFLTTKVSPFNHRRYALYREVFDGLPPGKQEHYKKEADRLLEERGVRKPGYFLDYFPGQPGDFEAAYLTAAMMPDYAHKVDASPELRKVITDSIEGSLRRVGTDHFDLLMCPHGANAPEDLASPEILATFQELRDQGKVRFLGVTSHNDPAGVLRAAADLGHYDAVMMAYNVVNGGYVEDAIRRAHAGDLGIIAMKVAMAVATHHEPLQPVPEWRIAKVERIVPGDWKAPQKAYLWALQNPRISAVISNLWDERYIDENLAVAGRKVELRPA
jgi:aryl-alcohol dehydrogenase-like predicted oxidoreductase